MADLLLLETSDYLLQEDNVSRILLEKSVLQKDVIFKHNVISSVQKNTIFKHMIQAANLLLLQTGFFLLQEDGVSRIVLSSLQLDKLVTFKHQIQFYQQK